MIVIQIETLQEFIDEICDRSSEVANATVRWQVQRHAEQKENVSRQVQVWATAIVGSAAGAEMLEYMRLAGVDSDTRGTKEGSNSAEAEERQLRKSLQEKSINVRPGKIEAWSLPQ